MIIVLSSMLVYGWFHSLLAGRVKPWFRTRFGERAYYGLYRALFNTMALLALAPLAVLMAIQEPVIVWTVSADLQPIVMIIQTMAVIGLLVSLLQIDLLRFAGIRQLSAYLNNGPLPLQAENLQTGGFYRFVRHPLYLFSIVALWSVTTMSQAYLGFCIGATIYFVIGSFYEEKRLVETFGESYIEYRQQVPWLVPFMRVPVSSSEKT